MVIHTDTPLVHKARNGVMEFLLINHPLDCPICDQGGECDLQDQAMAYGFDRGRFTENKRAVKDKYMGPLIKTFMTRCIHCTRCIRFADEIAGMPELGATGRGEDMEIGTYIENAVTSEMSGNMIDICPVGALTSKPFAYEARSWELRRSETIDVLDAVGCNIRVDSRGSEVMRVLPRLHEDVNEEWISDRTRFAYDGLKRQRLDRPYVRRDGKLRQATWQEAFAAIAARMKDVPGDRMAAIAGDLACAESMMALKDMMTALGSPHIDCRQDGAPLDPALRAGYIFNSGIAGIESADAILIVGANPRWEAALVNARIRKRWLTGGLKVGVIGPQVDLTYRTEYLGAGPQTLDEVANGSHSFSQVLEAADQPMIIVGMGAIARPDGAQVLGRAARIAERTGMVGESWNGFNVLHTAAARVGGLDLGFVPADGGRDVAGILAGAEQGDIDLVWLLGADEIDTTRLGNAFIVYQGHHGDRGAHRADVILPGSAYTEKNGTYVNTEGRVQQARMAVFPPGEAREDWKILRAFSEAAGHKLPYDTLADIRRRLVRANNLFAEIDALQPAAWGTIGAVDGAMDPGPFESPVGNFYMTDPITRASATMAKCVEEILHGGAGGAAGSRKTGTHG
jgi:NADH-quinone oxidoreductase subunit G